MSAQTEVRVRLAGVILLLVVAVAAAPVLDDVVGFLSEAPYVRYLPVVIDRGMALNDVLAPAVDAIRTAWWDRIPL